MPVSPTSRAGAIPAACNPAVVIGGKALHDEVRALADSAQTVLRADAFRISDQAAQGGLTGAHARGVDVRLRVDPGALGPDGLDAVRRYATLTEYGAAPEKQHAKGIVVDAAVGMIGTDITDRRGLRRIEMGVRFEGDAALRLDRLLQVTRSTDPAERMAVIDAARSAGIVLNDPQLGELGVSNAIRDTIAGASQRLLVATKMVDDGPTTRLIADRARNGVTTTVIAHVIPDAQAAALREAGVDLRVVSDKDARERRAEIHGTLLSADDRALVTSGYPSTRVLVPGADRSSRELGVVVEGGPAATLDRAMRSAYDAG